MPNRLLIEGAACPRCESPLVSIDEDAGDDPTTRQSLRNVDWWARVIGILTTVVIAFSVPYAISLWREGGSVAEWLGFGVNSLYAGVVLGLWIVAVTRAWWQLRTVSAGRLAACHACDHRWRL